MNADDKPPPEGMPEDPAGPSGWAATQKRAVLLVMAAGEPRARVVATLATLGLRVDAVETSGQAVTWMRRAMPDLVVLCEDSAGETIHDAVAAVRRESPEVGIVIWPSVSAAVELEAGTEPPSLSSEGAGLDEAPGLGERARRRPSSRAELDPFLGESEEIRHLERSARAALMSESPVLIEGETGTGKGVLATWLHRHGPRARQPFIDLNCAGFSRELMDSELFGHERGAFTGAVSSKPGLLEVAEGGTLFLDEIGDMDGPIQAKLLKVIEEKRFRRIGETRERHANVRIIGATHHDLSQLVREGRFREDLYYRIRVLWLQIPPLRSRPADLPDLITEIAGIVARDLRKPPPEITETARQELVGRSWPGNLRELRNTLERALLTAGDSAIGPEHLGAEEVAPPRRTDPVGGTLVEIERAHIERVLEEEKNVTRAAQRLGMARSTLYQKLHLLGITRRS